MAPRDVARAGPAAYSGPAQGLAPACGRRGRLPGPC